MESMNEIKEFAKANYIPIVRDKTAKKLTEICKAQFPSKILEIGTAIGYSGILMLKSSNARLYTIENNNERAKLAKENFEKYKVKDRVTFYIDDAQKVIEELCSKNEKFDLIFLDGAKGQYIRYYPYLKHLISGGGILFTDNIYLHGFVQIDGKVPHKHRSMVMNLRKFINTLSQDNDFETNFYDIDDGFSVSKLK